MVGTQGALTARPTISKNRRSKQFKPYLWLLVADVIAAGLGFAIAYLAQFETGIHFFNQINPMAKSSLVCRKIFSANQCGEQS